MVWKFWYPYGLFPHWIMPDVDNLPYSNHFFRKDRYIRLFMFLQNAGSSSCWGDAGSSV